MVGEKLAVIDGLPMGDMDGMLVAGDELGDVDGVLVTGKTVGEIDGEIVVELKVWITVGNAVGNADGKLVGVGETVVVMTSDSVGMGLAGDSDGETLGEVDALL